MIPVFRGTLAEVAALEAAAKNAGCDCGVQRFDDHRAGIHTERQHVCGGHVLLQDQRRVEVLLGQRHDAERLRREEGLSDAND